MSGSDNSTGGGYGGGGGGEVSCASLEIETQVSSPKADVIAQLKDGDVLQVALQQSGSVTLVILSFNNQLAGGVASPALHRLRECIRQGTTYVAVVIGISGGQVKIRIEASGAR